MDVSTIKKAHGKNMNNKQTNSKINKEMTWISMRSTLNQNIHYFMKDMHKHQFNNYPHACQRTEQ